MKINVEKLRSGQLYVSLLPTWMVEFTRDWSTRGAEFGYYLTEDCKCISLNEDHEI